MALSIPEAFEVKLRVENQLLVLPGVHAVGFGGKLRCGQPTGEVAIRVLVLKKKPKSQLAPGEFIREEIDGVKTDVIEAGIPIPCMLEGGIGVSFEGHLPGEVKIDEGTIGCFAWRQDTTPPKAVFLSNDHVLYGKTITIRRQNDDLVKLKACCGCSETVIARLRRTAGENHPLVDAAIAELEPELQPMGNWIARVHGVPITGTLDLRLPTPGTPDHLPSVIRNAVSTQSTNKLFVKKYGAATGLKMGVVTDVNCTSITRREQVCVEPVNSDYFSTHGDSGSVIYVDNSRDNNASIVQAIFGSPPVKNPDQAKIVALLWASDPIDNPTIKKKITIGSHIETVTALLNIKIATNPPQVVYQVGGEPKPHPALARVYSDLSATDRVKEFVTLYGKNADEIRHLLRHNRRFIVAWHRNHGPKMVRALIAVAENRAPFLPVEFEGKSWVLCVDNIANALLNVGSPTLKGDVMHYMPLATKLGGRSYEEILGFLVVSEKAKVVNEAESLQRP